MELDGREKAVLVDLVMWEGSGRGLWLFIRKGEVRNEEQEKWRED